MTNQFDVNYPSYDFIIILSLLIIILYIYMFWELWYYFTLYRLFILFIQSFQQLTVFIFPRFSLSLYHFIIARWWWHWWMCWQSGMFHNQIGARMSICSILMKLSILNDHFQSNVMPEYIVWCINSLYSSPFSTTWSPISFTSKSS